MPMSASQCAYTPRCAHPGIAGHQRQAAAGALWQWRLCHQCIQLTLASASGLAFDNSSIRGDWLPGEQGHGQLTLDNVNVAHLTPLSGHWAGMAIRCFPALPPAAS
jgi:hypothetical protein